MTVFIKVNIRRLHMTVDESVLVDKVVYRSRVADPDAVRYPIAAQACRKFLARLCCFVHHSPPSAGGFDNVRTMRKPIPGSRVFGSISTRRADRSHVAGFRASLPRSTRLLPIIFPDASKKSSTLPPEAASGYCDANGFWHHSSIFPCMSNRPREFGLSSPTGCGRSPEFS